MRRCHKPASDKALPGTSLGVRLITATPPPSTGAVVQAVIAGSDRVSPEIHYLKFGQQRDNLQ
jgi:hypothetical protein